MKKKAGVLWILAGVVLALVAGGLAFYLIMRSAAVAAPAPQPVPQSQVVVAVGAIPAFTLVQPGDVTVRNVPTDVAPANVLSDDAAAIGWLTINPLSAGEMLLASDVVSPTLTGKRVALTMDESRVAMAIPAEDIMSRNSLLEPGDHVDILFSVEVELIEGEDKVLTTFDALQNLEIAQILRTQDLQAEASEATGASDAPPLAIILTLDPQDALVLKNLIDREAVLDIVLRSKKAEDEFPVTPVNDQYIIDRYQLGMPGLP